MKVKEKLSQNKLEATFIKKNLSCELH